MNNILICLEKLGIGGVETAVINQAIALQKKENNVYIIANTRRIYKCVKKTRDKMF